MESPPCRNRLDRVVDSWASCFLAFFSARHQAAAFRRRNQRVVCRSNGEERILQIRSDELSRPSSLLRSAVVANFVRPKCLGVTSAGGPCEHRLRVACVEIRAVDRKKREPIGRASHGGVTRVCFLRTLLDPRSMAPASSCGGFSRLSPPLGVLDSEITFVRPPWGGPREPFGRKGHQPFLPRRARQFPGGGFHR